MNWLTKAFLLGLSFLGLGSLVYVVLTSDDDDDMLDISRVPFITARSVSVEISVPAENVGFILGHWGPTIRKIETVSNTKIYFRDARDCTGKRTFVIRGTTEAVDIAERLLYDAVLSQPKMSTIQLFVPIRLCSVLMGKYGETIRWFERLLHAKLTLDNWCFHNNYSTRKLYITGEYEQVRRARVFIAQKLEEDEPPPLTPGSVLPAPTRNRISFSILEDIDIEDDTTVDIETIYTTGNNGLLEVFVTAVENPEKFWIQIMGPNILALDRLADDMTEYYTRPTNRLSKELGELIEGKMIAAPYMDDNRWYRAEIMKVEINEKNDKESLLELFYVDFGDVGFFKKKHCCELSEEFLEMRFQAIQCELANIKTRDVWPEEAIKMFCLATCEGTWKTLSAKILDFKCRPVFHYKKSLPIPVIQLVDTTHPTYMDVALELVDRGYAEWATE